MICNCQIWWSIYSRIPFLFWRSGDCLCSLSQSVSWLCFNTAFLIYGLPFWIIVIRVHLCIKTFQSNIYLMTINYFKVTLWGRGTRKRGVHWLLRHTLLYIALPVIRPKNTYSSLNSLTTSLFLYNNQTSTKGQKIDITPTIKEFWLMRKMQACLQKNRL